MFDISGIKIGINASNQWLELVENLGDTSPDTSETEESVVLRAHEALPRLALPFVVGGALGNVADRVQYGAVADFLDFHYAGYHWYTFNIADMAIVGGAALLLLDSFRGTSGQETE